MGRLGVRDEIRDEVGGLGRDREALRPRMEKSLW